MAKYAPYIVPTEVARVERFKAGLIIPLYKELVATEFLSLTKLIDKAKQFEARDNEEKVERDQRKKAMGKPQSSQSKRGVIAVEQVRYSITLIQHRNKKKRGQFRSAPVHPTPTVLGTYGVGWETRT